MLKKNCQLKTVTSLLILVLLTGCSQKTFMPALQESNLLSRVKPNWFTKNSKHSIESSEKEPLAHRFFDESPSISRSNYSLNFIPLNIENDPNYYGFDLQTGRRFFITPFCSKKDAWKNIDDTIKELPFTVGIVPRFVDQLGYPQKIVVFGGKEVFQGKGVKSYRVQVVGGYVENLCIKGRCLDKGEWISHLVLVAVFKDNQLKVSSVDELRQKLNWKKYKAYLENAFGQHKVAKKKYAAIQAGNLLPAENVMKHFVHNSLYFSSSKMNQLQNRCFALYEKAWEDVGKVTEFEQQVTSKDDLKKRLQALEEARKFNVSGIYFNQRLARFLKQYEKELYTCARYVYAGNLLENREKFWFLKQLNLITRMHNEGFYYDCFQKAWRVSHDRHMTKGPYDKLYKCSNESINFAFKSLKAFLNKIKNQHHFYYRFIEYDDSVYGTEEKVYNWVRVFQKDHSCSKEVKMKVNKHELTYPRNYQWEERDLQKNDQLKGYIL